jgi:protein-tyrosine phosphatase
MTAPPDHPGVINLRDLGGWPTPTGQVRHGLFYRAASPVGLTSETARALVERTKLRTFFDLRSEREIERDGGLEALVRAGTQLVRVETGGLWRLEPRMPAPGDYAHAYIRSAPAIADALRAVVNAVVAGRAPVGFGCTMGKDRTGVLAALVLLALDVPAEAIAREYAMSAAALLPHLRHFEHNWVRKGLTRDQYAVRFDTRPETMRQFLEHVKHTWGTGRELLAWHGVSSPTAAAFVGLATEEA